jgi:ADP-ribose pyrophosphatase YjhB (NUDIX family)
MMIDADWEKPQEPVSSGIPWRVAAIVPLPSELGGAGEVLALSAFGSAKLPSGEARAGENVLAAAERVVLGSAGARVTAERVVYVHELAGRQLTLCVLCALDSEDDSEPRAGVRFVPLKGSEDDFEPPGIRELLIEDMQAGFVRPIAYLQVRRDEFGRDRVEASW